MASRNYYVVLGVASNETDQGVRAAFRDLAKRYHPDHVGAEGAATFREIAEAYDVLGNPRRRKEYDDSLRRPSGPTRGHGLAREVSMRRDLADVRPSEEAIFDRFARNFTGIFAPRRDGVRELQVEVVISADEGARGTRLRLGVPVFGQCARCRGQGCNACGWSGMMESERLVTIGVPPMSGRGTALVMPLSGLGIHNVYLRVRVRVDRMSEPISG
jgi:DnaJ-class molecular chaperone